MEEFNEAIIPKDVWKFVKKIIKNPVSAGILAMIIANFIRKHTNKEHVNFDELLENNELMEKFRGL